jgi:hypothetical protein
VIVLAAVLVLAGAGVGWASATGHLGGADTLTASGTFRVTDGLSRTEGAVCFVSGVFPDIATGTAVIITDASATTVAIGALSAGTGDSNVCVFRFAVPNVPAGKGFYGVEVASRGRVQFTEAEMRSGVRLTLGR